MLPGELDKEQLLRQDCLDRAISSDPKASAESLIEKAAKFEVYILNGRSNG